MKKRKIRIALRIMFNDPADGIELFVKEPWKRKEGSISFYLIQVEYWITGKIYYSLDFPSYYMEDSPDFSIKEVLIK